MVSLIPSIQNSILISKTVYQIYSIYTSLFQYNSQKRTFKTLGNVNCTKLKAWFEEVTVCLSRRAWRTPPVGAGDTPASVTHTRLCLTSSGRSPIFLSAALPGPFWWGSSLADSPRPLHCLLGCMHRLRVFPTYWLLNPPALVAFPNVLLAKDLFLAKRNFSQNVSSTPT